MKSSALLIGILMLGEGLLQADSPVTSTYFYESYLETVSVIEDAVETRKLSGEMIAFLADSNVTDDKKLALINALGWGESKNLAIYEKFLKKKYNLERHFFDSLAAPYKGMANIKADTYLPQLTTDEVMCWAYLKIMNDYFNHQNVFKAAVYITHIDDRNCAYRFLSSLVLAQAYCSNFKWCEVYQVMDEWRTSLADDAHPFPPEVVADIWEYIGIYEKACG